MGGGGSENRVEYKEFALLKQIVLREVLKN